MLKNLQNISVGHFWIGISDIIEENRWIYSSDLQPIKVNNFQRGEPNEHTSANCVALWYHFMDYGPMKIVEEVTTSSVKV